jgi:hypothetical protein
MAPQLFPARTAESLYDPKTAKAALAFRTRAAAEVDRHDFYYFTRGAWTRAARLICSAGPNGPGVPERTRFH